MKLKDRSVVHLVIVGEAGYPPGSGRKPVDTRRPVEACQIEDCLEPATQLHGFMDDPILTCDGHADEVMAELASDLLNG
jgi:hypothetical protein